MKDLNLYLKSYVNDLSKSILDLNNKQLEKATTLILGKIQKNKNIFVCGNGGSAAIANHYVCDYIIFFRDRTKFKRKKIKTIGFSGFDGGYLKRNCTASIHLNAKNYGISEDGHHILMHIIMQYIIYKFGKKNSKSIFKIKKN